MHASPLHYFPITGPFLLILFVVFVVVLVLVQLGILEYAYAKIGIQPRYVFLLLLLSLIGSYVNIPVAQMPPKQVVTQKKGLPRSNCALDGGHEMGSRELRRT